MTRVLIILAGTIACFLLVAWDRLFSKASKASKAKAIPVAYFDCKMGYWPEAEQAHNCVSFVIMQFDLEHPTLGISHGGPIAKENHNKPFSSIAPLKCEITFFNKDPMFNVQIPLTIDIFETIRSSGRNTRGRCINNIETSLSLNQVYIPDKKIFTFYVYSFDVGAYIGIRNHNIFKFSNSADGTRFEGKLINSNSLITSIGPAP